MKKILVLALLFSFCTAQSQLKYGLKAGPAMSSVFQDFDDTEYDFSVGTKISWFVAAVADYQFHRNWGLQFELNYSQLGYKKNYIPSPTFPISGSNIISDEVEKNGDIHLIAIPIQLKYLANKNFNVSGGINLGYILAAKEKGISDFGTAYSYNYFEEEDLSFGNTKANRLYFAVHFGAEYQFKNNLFIDARYNAGITDVNIPPTEVSTTLMNYFQLGIGYRFSKKVKKENN